MKWHTCYIYLVLWHFFSFSLYLSPESPLATRYGQSSRKRENEKKHSNKFFFVVVVFLVQFVFIYVIAPMKQTGRFFTLSALVFLNKQKMPGELSSALI